jgi:chaperonin cofactor prefoldin
MSNLIKQKQQLQTQLHQLENERQELGIKISDLEHQIWEISDKIQSECPHKNTHKISFFVTCFKCDDCGAIIICNSNI